VDYLECHEKLKFSDKHDVGDVCKIRCLFGYFEKDPEHRYKVELLCKEDGNWYFNDKKWTKYDLECNVKKTENLPDIELPKGKSKSCLKPRNRHDYGSMVYMHKNYKKCAVWCKFNDYDIQTKYLPDLFVNRDKWAIKHAYKLLLRNERRKCKPLAPRCKPLNISGEYHVSDYRFVNKNHKRIDNQEKVRVKCLFGELKGFNKNKATLVCYNGIWENKNGEPVNERLTCLSTQILKKYKNYTPYLPDATSPCPPITEDENQQTLCFKKDQNVVCIAYCTFTKLKNFPSKYHATFACLNRKWVFIDDLNENKEFAGCKSIRLLKE